ncbi:MAG: PQQ-binding-like beta-propeller repeat protein, partial [Planctomycetota bacterium]|nr:PQQ-binding-like beta-propeller repeat protein [Planctomycetota bacterium]
MIINPITNRFLMVAAALAAVFLTSTFGAEVTVALVAGPKVEAVSIEERQQLWKSPFGGWGMTVWPFALQVDDTPILKWSSGREKLMAQAGEAGSTETGALVEELVVDLTGRDDRVKIEDLTSFKFDRRASVSLELAAGRHAIHPFGIEFTVAEDDTLASEDPRVHIDANARRVEVMCHPVVFKLFAGKRSVAGRLWVTCASTSLLAGMQNVFTEFDRQSGDKEGTAAAAGYRRVTLYLPASVGHKPYQVNGLNFELDLTGQVKLPTPASGRPALPSKARLIQSRRDTGVPGEEGVTSEVIVQMPAAKAVSAPKTRPFGVSWVGAKDEFTIACGVTSVVCQGEVGSAWLPIPSAGKPLVKLGLDKHRKYENVRLPSANARYPHGLLLWDVAEAACWVIETPPLVSRPGAEWSCRITRVAGKGKLLPDVLHVEIEAVYEKAASERMVLKSAGGGVFTGILPSNDGLWSPGAHQRLRSPPGHAGVPPASASEARSAEPAGRWRAQGRCRRRPAGSILWRLRVAKGGPLKGQTLGMVLLGTPPSRRHLASGARSAEKSQRDAGVPRGKSGGEAVAPSVSLFTVRNRGVFRRGDSIDVLWSTRLPKRQLATEFPIVLRGQRLDTTVGRILLPERDDAGTASGSLKIDTTALAPGEYVVKVKSRRETGGPGKIVCYPCRFHVVQREPESDFELYSFFPVAVPSDPFPGSPVTTYKAKMPGGPGLTPFRADADASLDPALASYANAEAGPALETFARPTPRELDLMSLAAMGMRAAPQYPVMMHAEDQNPKHTLPEDLSQMRRRMALYAQQHADFPGLDGISIGWFATRRGFWESSPRLDGHQGRRNKEAEKWVRAQVEKAMAPYKDAKLPKLQRDSLYRWMNWRAYSSVLPHAFGHWFSDALEILPRLTTHNTKPDFWLGGWESFPTVSYTTLTHRDSLSYTDHCIPPWGNFRDPAFLAMGNPKRQRIHCSYFNHEWRSESVPIAFGAAGRGADGLSMTFSERNRETEALLSIFSRFGSWFTALDPLPDVAVYFNDKPNRTSVVLHDLARMRRPAMLVSPEDVLAGELSKYKVLFLTGLNAFELPQIEEAVRAFQARGGIIIKDDSCRAELPGRKLGFAYDRKHVHGGWGLGSPNGKWEFDHLWKNFKETREKFLVQAFAEIPGIPATTPDAHVIISPLAGKDSILCFTINQTVVPLEFTGQQWRQMNVMPRIGELRVENGWHVHDVLAGKAAPVESTPQGRSVAVDFTRFEGALFLLTKREPKTMAIRAVQNGPHSMSLTGWLADADGKPLADPMPFEVTLKRQEGSLLFHKYAALSPELSLTVPVPAMSGNAQLILTVADLILGSTATQAITPFKDSTIAVRSTPDVIGGEEKIRAFLSKTGRGGTKVFRGDSPAPKDGQPARPAMRMGPVTILLDEGQEMFRPSAKKLAELLRKNGREAHVVHWHLSDVRPLNLRWKPLKEDLEVMESLKRGEAFAWRIGLSSIWEEKTFDDPRNGYDEYGPRLRHDADIVIFGSPPRGPEDRWRAQGAAHRALDDLKPYLRRVPTDSYPAPGNFFVHYLWSPFQGGYDGLYLGCRDAAGADAAVAFLTTMAAPAPPPETRPDSKPVMARGVTQTPLPNMVDGKIGTHIVDIAFAPSGRRVFVTTTSWGDWFFVLSPSGEILDKRMPPVTDWFPNWWVWGRGSLRPVNDTSLYINLWDGPYFYDTVKGWISKEAKNPPHYLPGPRSGQGPDVKASTRLHDGKTGITYLGGSDRLHALDKEGRLLWRFEDSNTSGDLVYRRGIFPRAVSGNGRVVLIAAFGVHAALYATKVKNPSVMGIDNATGKLLWQRKGMMLNEGKVIALDDRFLVIDDDGNTPEIIARTGQEGTGMSGLTGTPDWVLSIPGGNTILIVENNHYDRQGRACRAYLRTIGEGKDWDIQVPGRVAGVALAPDGKTFVVTADRGKTLCFTSAGALQWASDTPTCRLVRYSPDSQTVVVGTTDGVVHFLKTADGTQRKRLDLNPANVISRERFSKQKRMGKIARSTRQTIPPEPPEPSYLKSLNPEKVQFGPNLAPPDRMRKLLAPAAPAKSDPANAGYVGRLTSPIAMTLKVEAGKTYLVEMLNAVANFSDHTPQLRLEVAVTGQKSKNLPCTVRLPIGRYLTRQRHAFRADTTGKVKLTLQAVLPLTTGEGKKAKTTYENAAASKIPVLLGDVVVSAIRFPGRNLVFDGGPGAGTEPAGGLTCMVYPWRD